MFKVKILDKKAYAGRDLVEVVEFQTREEAEAYARRYWEDPVDYQAILEDYSKVS